LPPVAASAAAVWTAMDSVSVVVLGRAYHTPAPEPWKLLLTAPRFAVVDHANAYEKAIKGLHGQQLKLAQFEGEGKDDLPYDPFIEEELEEERMKAIAASANKEDEEDDEEDEEEDYEENIKKIPYNPLAPKWNRKVYRRDGSLRRNKSELAILKAGAPAGGKIAIIALAGTQYKVTTEDVVIVNLLQPTRHWYLGSKHTLTDANVLLVSSSAMTCVGLPYVSGAEVDVLVEEITQDKKIVVFKKRRRKHSRRRNGFRRDITVLRVLDIRFPAPYAEHEHRERPPPAPLVQHTRLPIGQPIPPVMLDDQDQEQTITAAQTA
jgi:large subunit ribosomal protein L21